ncbi:MAG: hypothetical protein HY292_06115 [Planctomycetes bacterium]|nr:hypothetical protein [Planctomycetota bacterium]
MTSPLSSSRVTALIVFALATPSAAQVEWARLHPTSSPGGRTQSAMAYDSARSRAVYYSGYGATSETWEFDGVAWQQRATSAVPPPRPTTELAYDSARGRTILFGGPSPDGVGFHDTWEWDGTDWLLRTSPTIPTERWDFALAYDSTRSRTVMFGGFGAAGYLDETLEWDGADWIVRTPAHRPPARANHRLAYDVARGRTVLFGGADPNQVFGDTWEWTGDDWIQRAPPASPTPRLYHGLAYDVARGRTVLFGGADASGIRNDAWAWDGETWSAIATTRRPPVRYLQPMTYDSTCRRVLLFGGADSSTLGLVDTWVLGPPPGVASTMPALVAESGGEVVDILGDRFTESADTTVAFGGALGVLRDVDCRRLRVVTPPGSGIVDVTVTNALGTTTLVQGFTFVPDAVAARFGNVNAGRGARESPLLVNGNVGDVARELTVRVGQGIDAYVAAPSSRTDARFVVYAWLGAPDATSLTPLPRGLGTMIFPTPFAGTTPRPGAIWNNIGRFARIGVPTAPSSPAPSLLFRRPRGARAPAVVALQGLIQDSGSLSTDGFSITNAVVLHIAP